MNELQKILKMELDSAKDAAEIMYKRIIAT